MKTKLLLMALLGSAVSANAVTLLSTDGSVNSSIDYAIDGAIATQSGGAGEDLKYTVNTGGTFDITFTGGAVDFSFFNTELNQAVNFDGDVGSSLVAVADAGTWSYTAGTYDLSSVVTISGSTLTIGNARSISGQPGSANSNAPFSQTDWGTFSISGVQQLDFTYSDSTNFDGFRATAVIPEPSSFTLLGLGMAGLVLRRRRA